MCLNLKSPSQRVRIATKDIVVYKRLDKRSLLSPDTPHGQKCIAVINGYTITDAMIVKEPGHTFILTNNEHCNGLDCRDSQGYKYSWAMDSAVTSVVVDGKEAIEDVFVTPYQGMSVKIGETYTSKLVKKGSSVEEGLHTFVNPEKDNHMIDGDTCVECIIPKGSMYYLGSFNEICASYASDTLKYVRIIN